MARTFRGLEGAYALFRGGRPAGQAHTHTCLFILLLLLLLQKIFACFTDWSMDIFEDQYDIYADKRYII